MAKKKAPTPQEIYRQRKQREEMEKLAHLPPGLINHGNTCFMNSVLQGLIATRLLSDLVHFNPIPTEIQSTSFTHIVSRRSPQLTNGHNLGGTYEQPWVNTMPIGDVFLNIMYKSWDIQENRRREVLSPKALLGTLGQKYDQYLDFAQQDAHEFLRILLDAMRMEEQDIIKKRQPPPPDHNHKKRRRTTLTPNNVNTVKDYNTATPKSTSSPTGSSAPTPHDGSDLDPLLSFADMIFGGKLTSILVCQKCKHVSQTYEDFNDISLSIKPEDYFFRRGSNGQGKRDRLKKLAKRLTTFPGSGGGSHATQTPNLNANSTMTKPTFQALPSSTEMQRSSSVPPSPSCSRAGDGNAHSGAEDGGHSNFIEPLRRKSLDCAETGVLGTMLRVDVDVETPSTSGVETENEIEGVGRTASELEVSPPSILLEEVRFSELEPHEQGAGPASDDREEDKIKEDEIVLESDRSDVLVQVVSPEERHVELIEPVVKWKEKDGKDKKEDVGWAKLGRRISIMTGGLGRSKDKGKLEKPKGKEKDSRKSRSAERSGLGLPVKEKLEVAGSGDGDSGGVNNEGLSKQQTTLRHSRTATTDVIASASLNSSDTAAVPVVVTASSSSSGSVSTAAHTLFNPLPRASTLNTIIAPAAVSTSQLQSSQNHLVAPSISTPLPPLPNVQRSRSPKPPKLTAAESEYLRKILADVASSSSGLNSPFSLFKPPIHSFSTIASSGLTGSSGNGGGAGMWLGLNQFSGIEECLRLFTAVEVLDGENMVGCRRCWKIANGVFDVKSSTRQEEEDSDDEQEQEGPLDGRHETQSRAHEMINQDKVVLTNEGGTTKPRPALEALSIANINGPIHIPTSMSSPTVSFYTLSNSSDSRSISSLPAEATSVSDGNKDLLLVGFPPEDPFIGPGPGMPIPTISTTSPLDTPTDALSPFSHTQRLAVSAKESMVEPLIMDGAGTKNRTINGVLSGQGFSIEPSSFTSILSPAYATPSSPVPNPSLSTHALSAYNTSGSKHPFLAPKMPMYQRRKTYDSSTSPSASATDDEGSDDEQSDTSVGTSMSGRSYTSALVKESTPQLNQQQQPSQAAAQQTPTSTTRQTKPKEKKPKPVIMCPAYKRYLIAVPPPILVIHLKRFQQTSKTPLISFSHGLKKLDDYISFPEYLDLMPFLAPKKEDYGLGKKKKKNSVIKAKEEKCTYRLYAVVVHIGNMLGGHYIAYTALPSGSSSTTSLGAMPGVSPERADATNSRSEFTAQAARHSKPTTKPASEPRQWAFISDTSVRLTTLEEVLHTKAYICMYERC